MFTQQELDEFYKEQELEYKAMSNALIEMVLKVKNDKPEHFEFLNTLLSNIEKMFIPGVIRYPIHILEKQYDIKIKEHETLSKIMRDFFISTNMDYEYGNNKVGGTLFHGFSYSKNKNYISISFSNSEMLEKFSKEIIHAKKQ